MALSSSDVACLETDDLASSYSGRPDLDIIVLPLGPPPAYLRLVKPTIDRAVALVLLLLLLPVVVAVAVAVRVRLGRGVLYRQQRVGLGGEPFTIYKFRTMLPDRRSPQDGKPAEADRRTTHKTDHDPRHTPLGRFLRRWSLDELPQLWNVLLGDMSLIGPRPELVNIVGQYEPWQHRRHDVRPGLTGLWQVTKRGDGELMRYHTDTDIEYVEQACLRLDMWIMAMTVPVLLGRQGR